MTSQSQAATLLSPSALKNRRLYKPGQAGEPIPRHHSAVCCPPHPEEREPLQIPSRGKGTQWVPESQAGVDETGSNNWSGGLPQFNPLLWKTSSKTNAAVEYLPPVAERKARNLQNFFPLLHLLEEEAALEPKEEAVEEPLPDDCLDGLYNCLFNGVLGEKLQ